MSFNIIKNTLETQENGVLIIENDVYRIKMRYIGNYKEDLKNHKLNTDFLTVNSKIKQAHSVYMPTFTLMHDEVMFKIIDTGAGIFDEKSMDNMIADFTLAVLMISNVSFSNTFQLNNAKPLRAQPAR